MPTLNKLAVAIDILREVDPELQAQTLATLIEVARHPDGIKMQELAARVNISQSSVSRNISAMSHTHRVGKPGYNLVIAFEDPTERRRKIVRLTPNGQRLVKRLLAALES